MVAIDGPAGVGKSTVARGLARALGLPYLDTGAMYRAIALEGAARRRRPPTTAPRSAALAAGVGLELRPRDDGGVDVRLDGEPVEPHIRAPEVGEMASRLAAQPAVRARLVELQRAFGGAHGAVMEGRDIGTVVFPDTPFKFFLDAATRRCACGGASTSCAPPAARGRATSEVEARAAEPRPPRPRARRTRRSPGTPATSASTPRR